MCFSSWEKLLEKNKLADAALICTQDQMHFEPAMKAIEKGYHILLEKPMSPNAKECIILGEKAKEYNKIFSICHVLRFTNFFTKLKELLNEEVIGRLISVQHNENVGYFHQAHSFVRGNWRNTNDTSPMILQKCCHDMDILSWLINFQCKEISSFGDLTYFKPENAPENSADRCFDCKVENDCPYSALKIYLCENPCWVVDAICLDKSKEARTGAIKNGPYGRCVFKCDNNVVDHQVVNMLFKNDVTVAFTMCAFTKENSRTIKLMGTKGEIRGHMEKEEIEIIDFLTGESKIINIEAAESGHGGGDEGIMRDFVKNINEGNTVQSLTSANMSVQSHIMSLAAEESRLKHKVINIQDFIDNVE